MIGGEVRMMSWCQDSMSDEEMEGWKKALTDYEDKTRKESKFILDELEFYDSKGVIHAHGYERKKGHSKLEPVVLTYGWHRQWKIFFPAPGVNNG